MSHPNKGPGSRRRWIKSYSPGDSRYSGVEGGEAVGESAGYYVGGPPAPSRGAAWGPEPVSSDDDDEGGRRRPRGFKSISGKY